jgi:YVTN family beta-propeller protein
MATPPISGGTKLYAPNNENTGTVTVVNPTNGTSSTISVGALPTTAVLNADNTRLFVLNNGGTANSISVINTDNDSVVATITGFTRPWGAARTGSRLYVTNPGSGTATTVSMVNMTSNTIDATITVGSGPRDPAITPDGKRAYVPNQDGGTVSVINTDPASGAAYNTVIATLPLALSGDIFTSANAVAFSPDGRSGFVSLATLNQVKVIDTDPASPTYHRVLKTLATGSTPRGMAVWDLGAGQQRLFVANSGSNTVSVFTTPTP